MLRTLFIFSATIAVLFGLQSLHTSRAMKWKLLAPPPPHLDKVSFGFSDLMADSLWLRYIQDSTECEVLVEIKPFEQKQCTQGWGFQMLDSITDLAPKFRMPYAAGAISLSVLNSDYPGANRIFEKGIQNFPNDWSILYRAAYHYLFDQKDKAKAAELLNRAMQNGAPPWLASLAARLYTQEGELELGIRSLETYRANVLKNPEALAEVDKRLADLRAKLAQTQKQ